MNSAVEKFETPDRLRELSPAETLGKIGLAPGNVFCDIGAGTGIFTFAAREVTNQVFSLETNDALLAHMKEKAATKGIDDITFVKSTDSSLGLPDEACDVVLLCTVLHELTDTSAMLSDIRRIIRPGGTFAVIEFHKADTPLGPPVEHRIAEKDTAALVEAAGLKLIDTASLGPNFYRQVYRKGHKSWSMT